MKERRYFSMETVIIAVVSVTTAVSIALLCVIASVNSNAILRDNINGNMSSYLDSQVNSVEEFVSNSEQKLKLFSKSELVKQLIREDLADAEANPARELPEFADESYNTTAYFTDNYPSFAAAQQYTLDYYSALHNWEGLYVGNFETRVLAYSVPPVIGKVLRPDPEKVNELMDGMKANPDGVLNAGIIVSPGTGKLCLSMYCPVFDGDKMIGYVGAGVFHTELEELLKSNMLSSGKNSFYMINTQTGITYTDTEVSEGEKEAVIAHETQNPILLEVISRSSSAQQGQFEYNKDGKNLIVSYEKIPGHEWALVITVDKKELYAVSKGNIRMMVILGIIAFALIIILVKLLTSGLSRSLKQTVREIDKTANGDISSGVTISSSVAEINDIKKSLMDLKHKLTDVIDKTKDMSDNLNAAGSDLTDSADQASNTSSNVTNAVADISKGAMSQAESVQTAAECTDTIGSSIDDISGNISTLDGAMGDMKENCGKVASALKELVHQNSTVSDAISEIEETITATDKSANEIARFSDAINDIASQTNLLSLNASIEAARAGESGRGFAVVADEIRQLADQSKSSAEEIKTIIDKLTMDVKSSVKTMDALNEGFKIQGEQILSAQRDMEEMSGNMAVVSDNSESISRMVNNLESAKKALVDVVENLSTISRENALSTEETSVSMNKFDVTFTVINESASQLRSLASELADTISYFK